MGSPSTAAIRPPASTVRYSRPRKARSSSVKPSARPSSTATRSPEASTSPFGPRISTWPAGRTSTSTLVSGRSPKRRQASAENAAALASSKAPSASTRVRRLSITWPPIP